MVNEGYHEAIAELTDYLFMGKFLAYERPKLRLARALEYCWQAQEE